MSHSAPVKRELTATPTPEPEHINPNVKPSLAEEASEPQVIPKPKRRGAIKRVQPDTETDTPKDKPKSTKRSSSNGDAHDSTSEPKPKKTRAGAPGRRWSGPELVALLESVEARGAKQKAAFDGAVPGREGPAAYQTWRMTISPLLKKVLMERGGVPEPSPEPEPKNNAPAKPKAKRGPPKSATEHGDSSDNVKPKPKRRRASKNLEHDDATAKPQPKRRRASKGEEAEDDDHKQRTRAAPANGRKWSGAELGALFTAVVTRVRVGASTFDGVLPDRGAGAATSTWRNTVSPMIKKYLLEKGG